MAGYLEIINDNLLGSIVDDMDMFTFVKFIQICDRAYEFSTAARWRVHLDSLQEREFITKDSVHIGPMTYACKCRFYEYVPDAADGELDYRVPSWAACRNLDHYENLSLRPTWYKRGATDFQERCRRRYLYMMKNAPGIKVTNAELKKKENLKTKLAVIQKELDQIQKKEKTYEFFKNQYQLLNRLASS